MRIRRTVIVFMLTLLAVPALAGPASAGGRPAPPPPHEPLQGWMRTGARRHRTAGSGEPEARADHLIGEHGFKLGVVRGGR